MQLRQLEYVIKIAECGSITHAAEQLFISQPSLTKSIFQLENEYGIQIFIRKKRGVELTEDGKDFIRYAKAVLNAAEILNFRFSAQHPQSRLFVGTQQFDFVYSVFHEVYRDNEGQSLHYSLVETDRNRIIEQVLNGMIDLGIIIRSSADGKTFLWHTEAKRLDIEVLATSGTYACVGPKSPFYNNSFITPADTSYCTSLILDMDPQTSDIQYFSASQHYFNSKKQLFFNTVSACEHFLLNTDALLFVNKWAMGCFENSKIHFFPVQSSAPTEVIPTNELLLLKRSGDSISYTGQQFIRMLKDHIGKMGSTL